MAKDNKKRLQTYLDKRDFDKTPEPAGNDRAGDAKPVFVIQQHAASSHHYDFRLEVDGVLVSWAVPKGPSTDPSEKRLALRTEDHPMDYVDFEGVIPEDQYGGGTVQVWDAGSYRNLKEKSGDGNARSMAECVSRGHLTVWLQGEKLTGGYALTRFGQERNQEQWLLVKMDDEEADARRNPVSTENQSVLTGRTMDQIADE